MRGLAGNWRSPPTPRRSVSRLTTRSCPAMRTVCAWLLSIAACGAVAAPALAVDYVRDVKPILRAHCTNCHGPLRQKAGLRLDHVAFIREGGDSGPAIDAAVTRACWCGRSAGTADFDRMPLDAKPLSDEAIATLAPWVNEGARRPKSRCPTTRGGIGPFKSRSRPSLPEVSNRDLVRASDRSLPGGRARAARATSTPPAASNLLLSACISTWSAFHRRSTSFGQFAADPSDAAYAAGGRQAAGQPPVRRAVGPALDGRVALQRLGRLRGRGRAKASRTSGGGAIGSSNRSTPTSPTTA